MKRNTILSLGLMVLLLTSTFAIVMPQKSYAAVTITSSVDSLGNKFFGPSLARVLIEDTALRGSPPDEITVSVEVVRGTTSLGSTSIPVAEIGTSGQFELYIAAHTTANPANPTQTDKDNVSIVRIYSGATSNGQNTAVGGANNTLDDPVIRAISRDLQSGDKIRVTYGGTTKEIIFESSTASLTTDRTTAGHQNKIILRLNDQDANRDPTKVDTFPANATNLISPTSPTLTFASSAQWKETGQNTGIFELVVGVNTMVDANLAATFPSSATFTVKDHDVYNATSTDKSPYDHRTDTTSTTSRTVTLQNVDGSITLQAPLTIANGFQIKITDADRNIDTTTKDTFDVVNINGTGTVPFIETGDNTGEFVPNLANNRVPIVIGTPTGFDNTNKVYKITIDNIAGDKDITLTYNDPAAASGPQSFTIVRKIQHVAGTIETTTPSLPVTGTAILTINDNDINTNSLSANSHTVSLSVSPSGKLEGDVANGLGKLTIEVVGKTLSGSSSSLSIVFREVDAQGNPASNTGIFRGELRISDIDTRLSSGSLVDGDKIKVTYKDNTESPATERSVEIRIGKPSGIIKIDRSSYPPSSKIYVEITDPSFNTSATSENTLNLDFGTTPDEGSLRLELTKGTTTFTFKPGYQSIPSGATVIGGSFPASASETDVNSGVFTVEITLPTTVNGITIGDGWQVRLIYKDSNGDDRTATATIITTTASISTDKSSYALGNTIELTIREPDWNKDSKKIDEITLPISNNKLQVRTDKFSWADLDSSMPGGISLSLDPSNLRETGENTGVFVIKLKDISEDFVSRGSRVEFRYTDTTPTGGGRPEKIETRVNIIEGIPEIIFDKDAYTPFDEVCITIVDPSANVRPDTKDTIGTGTSNIEIEVSGMTGNPEDLVFEETDVNSGIFMYQGDECLKLDANAWSSGNTANNDGRLPAARDEAIRVTYEAANGDIRLTKSALIVFNDGSISFDKSSYKVGEEARITVIDPDLNTNNDVMEQVSISVFSSTDRAGVTIQLRETEEKSGVFTGKVILTSDASTGSRLQVRDGDTITARYVDRTLPDPADYNPDTNAKETLDVRRLDATATIGITKLPIERAPASTPEVVDELGNKIEEITVGTQVLIRSAITNNQTISQNYVHIFKVTDEDGNIVLISFTQGTLNPNEVRSNAVSFTPERAGTYTIEILVWESFDKPIALSPKVEQTISVT